MFPQFFFFQWFAFIFFSTCSFQFIVPMQGMLHGKIFSLSVNGLCSSANPSPMCSNKLVCCRLIFSISTESESTQGKSLFVPWHFGESLLFPSLTLAHSDWQMPLQMSSSLLATCFAALTKSRRFHKRISPMLSLSRTIHLNCSIELPEIVLQGNLKEKNCTWRDGLLCHGTDLFLTLWVSVHYAWGREMLN